MSGVGISVAQSFGVSKPLFLFGIGAQKSGTTWVYDLLKSHPDCHCSDIKEFHYFDVMHLKGERVHLERRQKLLDRLLRAELGGKNKAHLAAFDKIERLKGLVDMYPARAGDHARYISLVLEGYADQKIACDITPAYATLNRTGFRDMASISPSRFLFIMREPVDRIWSQIRMFVASNGTYQTPDLFAEACVQRVRDLHSAGRLPKIPRANYARTIQELESVIPQNDILYLFFEDLIVGETIDHLWDFLGIAHHPADTDQRANRGKNAGLPEEAEALLLDGLRDQYYFVFEKFGDAVPTHWQARLDALPRKRRGWVTWPFTHLARR